jgi:hypothetical protein
MFVLAAINVAVGIVIVLLVVDLIRNGVGK